MTDTPLPATGVSISDGMASLMLEPHSRELTKAEKIAILAAERVRIFIDARVAAKLSRPLVAPSKISDYPADTVRFCIQHATLVCVGLVDCRADSTVHEIESLLREFDTKEVEDSRFVVRILTDSPFDFGDYISRHRPYVSFRIASPNYAETEQGTVTADKVVA